MSEENKTGIPISAILGNEPASVTVPVVDVLSFCIENVIGSLTLSSDHAELIARKLSNRCKFELHASIERGESGKLNLTAVSFVHTPDNWDEGGGYR